MDNILTGFASKEDIYGVLGARISHFGDGEIRVRFVVRKLIYWLFCIFYCPLGFRESVRPQHNSPIVPVGKQVLRLVQDRGRPARHGVDPPERVLCEREQLGDRTSTFAERDKLLEQQQLEYSPPVLTFY